MGKGDQRSRKGKIKSGSYGKSRPHKPESVKKRAAQRRPTPSPQRPRR
jgi:ribosomal small subunit protein bTHX